MTLPKRKVIYLAIALVLALLVVLAFLPDPVPVETEEVARGSMQVTIDEQGKTRVIDRFTITAPTAGRLARIDLREGAAVLEGTVVARIAPAPLDSARGAELQAMLQTAQAAQQEASAAAARAESAWELRRQELRRVQELARGGIVSPSNVDTARMQEETSRRELAAARAAISAAASNVAAARARLLGASDAPAGGSIAEVRSPAAGRILRVPDRSSRVVQPGQPLLEIGNANRLELVIEVLSEDAVKIRAGNEVIVREWGGDQPLRGTVRVVEPGAFTKFSALGIEEQRVNVIADVNDAPASLGDAYRIEASIVVWSAPSTLKVPISALGRAGDRWSVFVAEDGRAKLRTITIGQRNPREAEVREGLREGERVIVHPGTDVADGARIRLD